MAKNKKLRITINGFGRIGRQVSKIAFERPELETVAFVDGPMPKLHKDFRRGRAAVQ